MANTKPKKKGSGPQESTRRCFVILPFAGEYDDIFHYAIRPAAERSGYQCERVSDLPLGEPIGTAIVRRIASADLLTVDVSQPSPNLYFELGIACGLAIPVLILARRGTELPADLQGISVLMYDSVTDLGARLNDAFNWFAEPEGSASRNFVARALPQLDRVPRAELNAARSEAEALKRELASRIEAPAQTAAQPSETNQFTAFRAEIAEYFKNLTADVLGSHVRELAATSAEVERLKRDNEQLRGFELEVRRLKEAMVVNPRWPARRAEVEADLCFLLMPFSEPWSDDAWKLIEGIVGGCGMRCRRADEQDGRVVMEDIWDGICRAKVVIADLTNKNSNVTYEVGLADVLGKDVILLSQTPDDVPFDFLGLRLVTYENSFGGVRRLTDELRKRLERFRPAIAGPASSS